MLTHGGAKSGIIILEGSSLSISFTCSLYMSFIKRGSHDQNILQYTRLEEEEELQSPDEAGVNKVSVRRTP